MKEAKFNFLKSGEDAAVRPLLAANVRFPNAASPIIQNRAGEYGFMAVIEDRVESRGPFKTAEEAWDCWYDLQVFAGYISPLNLFAAFKRSKNQTPVGSPTSEDDFTSFMKNLGAEV